MEKEKLPYLTFEEFIEQIQNKLREHNDKYELVTVPMIKNNDIKLTGLTITNSKKQVMPVVYMDNFYQTYLEICDLNEIAEEIEKILFNNQVGNAEELLNLLYDFSKVKERIVYELINTERNRALLQTLPHREFLNLSIVYKIVIDGVLCGDEIEDAATIRVTDNFIRMWKITEEELFNLAEQNTVRLRTPVIYDITDVMPKEIQGNLESKTLYVLTNTKKICGASAILNKQFMSEVYEKIGNAFYVIPSSTHEMIAVDKDKIEQDGTEINQMIKEVNHIIVEEHEILGDKAYYFDGVEFSIIED